MIVSHMQELGHHMAMTSSIQGLHVKPYPAETEEQQEVEPSQDAEDSPDITA